MGKSTSTPAAGKAATSTAEGALQEDSGAPSDQSQDAAEGKASTEQGALLDQPQAGESDTAEGKTSTEQGALLDQPQAGESDTAEGKTSTEQGTLLGDLSGNVDAVQRDPISAAPQPVERAIAFALIDIPRLDVKAGQLVDASAAEVRALVSDGQLDDHPDAVAHARGCGASVVRVD